eukprot:6184306-Pleurochrysis_carterae.AAC.1
MSRTWKVTNAQSWTKAGSARAKSKYEHKRGSKREREQAHVCARPVHTCWGEMEEAATKLQQSVNSVAFAFPSSAVYVS